MNIKQVKQTLIDNMAILNHYGVEKQIPVWIEEMSELTKALCKWIRNGKIPIDDLKEEIADLTVCLDQLKYAVDYMEDELMGVYKKKVDRQLERIEQENNPFIF